MPQATDFNGYTAREMGFPAPPPPPPGPLPPGGGGYTTPYWLQFASLMATGSRTFRFTFDEALRNNPANARAMYRDAVIKEALRGRMIPTAQLTWHIDPWDDTDPAQVEAAAILTAVIERIPNFQALRMQLLQAVWYGRSACQLHFAWKSVHGRQCLVVDGFEPVNGDSLRFRRDGQPGILVHSTYPGTWEATDFGPAHFITPDERFQYVIHEHERYASDFLEGDMAGSVHGVGVRNDLYWIWWLKQQVMVMMMDYLEKFSKGMTVIYYDAHSPNARAEMEKAARESNGQPWLLLPRWAETRDTNAVQRIEAGTASPALLQELVTQYFDDIIRRVIIGQTLSSSTAPTGMGSGVADFHGMTLSRIIKYDAVNLADTIQRDLIPTLARYCLPEGVEPGRFSFEVDTPNAEEVLGYAETMYDMGLSLDEDQLYKISQLQKPRPGAGIVSKLGAMQPAAVGAAPQGVPVAGEAGPEAAPAGQGQSVPQGADQASPAEPVQTVRRQSRVSALVGGRGPVRLRKHVPVRRVVCLAV